MLTEADREQFKKNFRAGWELNKEVLPWVIEKIIDSLPIQGMQFEPTIRHCEYCRHQGECPHKEDCSRAYRQKDYYRKR